MKKENFNLFNEIDHGPLKVYNRVVMSYNLKDDFGDAVLEDYLSCFDAAERKQLLLMTMLIKSKGKDEVKKLVTSSLLLDDE